jgi:hypothetical protein
VAIVSSFLVNRAGGARADIDPDRLRRVTVQPLQRRRVDPGTESDSDADLVSTWIRRALKSAVPFAKGGVTPHAKRIAAAAATRGSIGAARVTRDGAIPITHARLVSPQNQ